MFSETCIDILTMSVFYHAGWWSVTLLAPGGIHKITFSLSADCDQDSSDAFDLSPACTVLTQPSSEDSSPVLLHLSNFCIFHHLSSAVCLCLSSMCPCLFPYIRSTSILCPHPYAYPLLFIQNQTDDPDSPH